METIKNALGFGSTESDSTQEPLSGQTGAGTATDPYDAGNAKMLIAMSRKGNSGPGKETVTDVESGAETFTETHDAGNASGQPSSASPETLDELPKDIRSQSGQGPLSGHTGAGIAADPYDAGITPVQSGSSAGETTANEIASSRTKSPPSAIQTDTSDYPGLQGHPLLNSEPTPIPTPAANLADRNLISPSEPFAGLESSQEPTYKEQGADRPLEVPSIQQTDAVIGEKLETESTQAGQPVSDALPNTGASNPEDQSEKPLGTFNKGTGEKYVESTGLAAHGGDFDAANPGAGKEADRLLEESGTHHGDTSAATADSDLADSTKKMKLSDKIKGKLHLKKKSSAG